MTQVKRRSFLKCGLAGTAATAASLLPMAAHAQSAEAKQNQDYDVIVVGCGCAGMAAAIEAADKGAKVAIFEKMSRPAGNTIFAGGHFNATNTYVQKQQNMKDTLDDFYKDMMIVSQQRGDQALTRQYCEMSGSAIQWLTDTCGIKWKPIVEEVFPGRNRGHVVDGKLKPGGAQLSKQMLDTVRYLNTQDIQGVKFQLLHILEQTDLAAYYREHPFPLPDMEEYFEIVGSCLCTLRPDIVVHRLTGDGPKALLIAPLWTGNKRQVLNQMQAYLKKHDIWQGKALQ